MIIRIPQTEIKENATAREIALTLTLIDDATRRLNPETLKVEYTITTLKRDMLTNAEFLGLTQIPGIEIDEINLWLAVDASILDQITPAEFPHSYQPEVRDPETDELVHEGYQMTYRQYFARSVEINGIAILELWGKHPDYNYVRKEHMPDLETFNLYYSDIMSKGLELPTTELLVPDGKTALVEQLMNE